MRKWFVIFGFLLVSACALAWWVWPSVDPEVVVCEVGQGDGVIITLGFSQMVIDVGRNDRVMLRCLGEALPFWDRETEMMIITHADADHSGGLIDVASLYAIDWLLTSEKALDEIRAKVSDATEVQIALMGQSWRWGVVTSEVMQPPSLATLAKKFTTSTNDSGVVMRLDFNGKASAWFAADSGEAVEKVLIDLGKVRPTTMLKVSHHGSRYATSEPFLKILQPRLFFISVGKNSYGHPTKEVLDRISQFGGEVKRTDQRGTFTWKPL